MSPPDPSDEELSRPEHYVRQLLILVGDDADRPGLKDTPARVVRSWHELYSGYLQDPEALVTSFPFEDGQKCDEIVLLRDIELYSTCEHHMLPFYGKAHVAYLPNDSLLGISKLARLVEVYARRLQIQERIGTQVTKFLMGKHVRAKGAACIITAQHMCIQMRGIQKQNSVMVTSSLEGVFMEDGQARSELMSLIRL